MIKNSKKCPQCSSLRTIKRGIRIDIQTYYCNNCGKYFSDERREKTCLEKELWKDYVFHKQTIRELSIKFNLDKKVSSCGPEYN